MFSQASQGCYQEGVLLTHFTGEVRSLAPRRGCCELTPDTPLCQFFTAGFSPLQGVFQTRSALLTVTSILVCTPQHTLLLSGAQGLPVPRVQHLPT